MKFSPGAACFLMLLALLAGVVAPAAAQTISTTTVVATPPQPVWQELSETQQQILAPLAEDTLKYSTRKSPAAAIAVSVSSRFQVAGSAAVASQTRTRSVVPTT